ncbi:MAG TPA: hypothetical protein DDY86_09270 [Syntrophaceae bacterium]|nr:hypothetical protein [Syntrophaceae bacterium]
MPIIQCGFCGRGFSLVPAKVRPSGNFCSRKCRDASKVKKILVKCVFCGKSFLRKRDRADIRINNFCSVSCYRKSLPKKVSLTCSICGSTFDNAPAKAKSSKNVFCSIRCKAISQRVEKTRCGYREVSRGRERVQHHRRVMEEFLGRKLTTDEIVHHVNGNKTDDRFSNLEILDRRSHARKHKPLSFDIEAAKVLRCSGHTFRQIAEKFGRHPSTIRNGLFRYGFV